MLGKTKFHISLTPSSAFSDSLRDGSLKIIWYTFYHFTFRSGRIKKRLFRNFRHSPRARPRFQSSPRGWFPGTRCPSATTPKYSDKIKNSIKYFHSSLFSLFLLLTSSSNCLADGLSELWSENALTDWLGGLSISNNRTNINKINLFYIHWKRQIILLMSMGLLHLDGNIETKLRDVASYYTRWE